MEAVCARVLYESWISHDFTAVWCETFCNTLVFQTCSNDLCMMLLWLPVVRPSSVQPVEHHHRDWPAGLVAQKEAGLQQPIFPAFRSCGRLLETQSGVSHFELLGAVGQESDCVVAMFEYVGIKFYIIYFNLDVSKWSLVFMPLEMRGLIQLKEEIQKPPDPNWAFCDPNRSATGGVDSNYEVDPQAVDSAYKAPLLDTESNGETVTTSRTCNDFFIQTDMSLSRRTDRLKIVKTCENLFDFFVFYFRKINRGQGGKTAYDKQHKTRGKNMVQVHPFAARAGATGVGRCTFCQSQRSRLESPEQKKDLWYGWEECLSMFAIEIGLLSIFNIPSTPTFLKDPVFWTISCRGCSAQVAIAQSTLLDGVGIWDLPRPSTSKTLFLFLTKIRVNEIGLGLTQNVL